VIARRAGQGGRSSSRRPRWGQNFLVDPGIANAIVEWAAVDGRSVLEIGPGRGALTRLLAKRARDLVAVEIDPILTAQLREVFMEDPHVHILSGDILAMDPQIQRTGDLRVVANLPYESGTEILMHVLASFPQISEMVLMLQREVSERIASTPGTKSYGRLSVQVQIRADVELGRTVSPGCFRPKPQVESRLLRVRPLPGFRFPVGEESHFASMVAAAFAQRRKMVKNALASWLRDHGEDHRAVPTLEAAGIRPDARPEEVGVEEFAALAALTYSAAGNPCPNCPK
jgi:16S rRNA (adenine1518-N6/adenine1519-N6)-dimethyltransferase